MLKTNSETGVGFHINTHLGGSTSNVVFTVQTDKILLSVI